MNEILVAYYEGLPLQEVCNMLYAAYVKDHEIKKTKWFRDFVSRRDIVDFMLPEYKSQPHWIHPNERKPKSGSEPAPAYTYTYSRIG